MQNGKNIAAMMNHAPKIWIMVIGGLIAPPNNSPSTTRSMTNPKVGCFSTLLLLPLLEDWVGLISDVSRRQDVGRT